jgi:hypothetical protein
VRQRQASESGEAEIQQATQAKKKRQAQSQTRDHRNLAKMQNDDDHEEIVKERKKEAKQEQTKAETCK